MKLSEHFDSSEFECHCGKCAMPAIDSDLLELLEIVRSHFGKPVGITSGYRCEAHNKAVGGAKNSQHCQGIAADITVKGITPSVVHEFLSEILDGRGGLGLYSGWVHVDTRASSARWNG